MGDRQLTVTDLRPGDEIVVVLASVTTTADDSRTTAGEYAGSASPGPYPFPVGRSIDADEIRILRRPQAP